MKIVQIALALQSLLTVQATAQACYFLTTDDLCWLKGYEPVVINSYNIEQVMRKMEECDVERARIGGWNFRGNDLVLHQNGALVPAIPEDLPEYTIYVKMCEDRIESIVFIKHDCGQPALYAQPNVCQEPVVCERPKVCHESPVIVYPEPPVVVYPEPAVCKKPVVCKERIVHEKPIIFKPELICHKAPESSSDQSDQSFSDESPCKPIPRFCKKVYKKHGCQIKELLASTKQFVLTTKKVCGKKKLFLVEKKQLEKNTLKTCCLNKSSKFEIKILNKPKILFKIIKELNRKLGNNYCLYVNDNSCLFVLYKDCFYWVHCRNELKLRKLKTSEAEMAVNKGLYLITRC